MKKRDDVLVGLVMLVAIIVAITGSLWLARGGLSKGYALYAKFPWSSGLKQGQPVLLAGVNVGYVDEVKLRQDGTVLTTFRVGKEYQVPQGTVATVVANGIFGDMAIALTPVRPNPRSIPENDTVPVGPSAPGLAQITGKADSIATSVNAITTAFQKDLVAAGGIEEMRRAIASTNRLVNQFSSIAAEQNRQLTATFASFRKATSGIDSAKIDSTLVNLREASANMASISEELRATSLKLDAIVAKVDSGNGTASKLLNDAGVYDDVRKLLAQLDTVLVDFKNNPRRYINLKVF
ncbi:MAG: MCE family protein [Gemmatimonadaceae bacterium]|nr:MCE family protein [Gemmatimonadaceae bacterium]